MKNFFLASLGFLFLAFGAVGIVIPLWPTTPFVLISLFFFSSCPKTRARVLKINFIKEHYENYRSGGGLSKKTLIISLAWLWGMLFISLIFVRQWWVLVLLFLVGAAVTTHLLFMARKKLK